MNKSKLKYWFDLEAWTYVFEYLITIFVIGLVLYIIFKPFIFWLFPIGTGVSGIAVFPTPIP